MDKLGQAESLTTQSKDPECHLEADERTFPNLNWEKGILSLEPTEGLPIDVMNGRFPI